MSILAKKQIEELRAQMAHMFATEQEVDSDGRTNCIIVHDGYSPSDAEVESFAHAVTMPGGFGTRVEDIPPLDEYDDVYWYRIGNECWRVESPLEAFIERNDADENAADETPGPPRQWES